METNVNLPGEGDAFGFVSQSQRAPTMENERDEDQ